MIGATPATAVSGLTDMLVLVGTIGAVLYVALMCCLIASLSRCWNWAKGRWAFAANISDSWNGDNYYRSRSESRGR